MTSMNKGTKEIPHDVPIITAPALVKAPDGEPAKIGDKNIAPTTTAAEDLTKAGQHEINLVWEKTQMKIALSVIWASLAVSGALAVMGKHLGTPDLQLAAVVFLFGVANLVTGFYFGRTNHERSAGGKGESR